MAKNLLAPRAREALSDPWEGMGALRENAEEDCVSGRGNGSIVQSVPCLF